MSDVGGLFFDDQAKKWKEKEKRKNYVHFVGLVSVGL
jgi:hypothetical protein